MGSWCGLDFIVEGEPHLFCRFVGTLPQDISFWMKKICISNKINSENIRGMLWHSERSLSF